MDCPWLYLTTSSNYIKLFTLLVKVIKILLLFFLENKSITFAAVAVGAFLAGAGGLFGADAAGGAFGAFFSFTWPAAFFPPSSSTFSAHSLIYKTTKTSGVVT